MKTDILTPKDLFRKYVQYTIPPFQRHYIWTQDDQWEPLWDDVRNVAENYLEELERSDNDMVEAEQRTKPHFLGAVVLQQVHTAARDIEQREVIDGQQRATTLQLLLDAIQGVCEEKALTRQSKRLLKFVTNGEDAIGDEAHHIFKLWPTRSDREAFKHAMDNGLAVKGFERSLIVQAHEFFQTQVREWIDDGTGSIESRMDALETAATAMLQMVVIDLDPEDDPNVIFETLNARGTPLEQSDLIKNFVLSGDRESDMWDGLDDTWWREEVRQGRLYRPRLDMLLNYWLAMRTGSEVGPSRVFDTFRAYVENRRLDDVMTLVKKDLTNYRRFRVGSRTPDEESFYYRTNVMQTGAITPVLLLLLSAEHGTRIRAFCALESFLIRRMVCRQTTKDYNRLTLELARRLREDGGLESADKVVAGFLKEQTAYSRKWPSDETVAHSLESESSPLYRLLTRGRLRLVLEGIEGRLLLSSKSERRDVEKNLTIEHLMPQGWKGNWPLPPSVEGAEEVVAEQERNRLIHSIGNLTLATGQLNSSMSNAPWECKRAELHNHSTLMLNKELTSEPCWNEDLIRARSKRMAALISECWPGPDSQVWER